MSDKMWWYLARSSGLVAWLILAASVVWGLFLSTRILQDKRRPAWLLDLHRWLGALSIVFTALHLMGLVFDSYVDFGIKGYLVPFAEQSFEPASVAWGIVALYLLIAVQITSLVMKKLPRKLWKAVHYTSFALFFMASLHSAFAGSDTSTQWYKLGSVGILTTVLFTIAYRVLTAGARRRSARVPQRRTEAA